MKQNLELLRRLHDALLEAYGPRGWWPLLSRAGARGFDARGYHPGVFDRPRTAAERFEVVLGAILTQNTAWTNAERALLELGRHGLLDRTRLTRTGEERLARLIVSSGYFRQKAKKIRAMVEFLGSGEEITRETLLGVWGVGRETADSILLYAYHRPVFVVDAYTVRILERLGMARKGEPYDAVQARFHDALPRDAALFNEYHALLVEHGKRHYSRKPYGGGDEIVRRVAPGRRRRTHGHSG